MARPQALTVRRVLRRVPFAIVGGVLFFLFFSAAFPSLVARYPHAEQHADDALQAPSARYWLGTDQFGRDIYSRLIHGTRVVILVGLGSVALAVLVGIPLGMAAGYYGGWVDAIIMRFQDAILSFPALLLALLIIASFGASTFNVILTIAFVYVPRFARLVRGSVMGLKDREYVLATRVAGASDTHLLFLAILPNVMGPIIVQSTLGVAVAILIEAGLSYLGLGIQPPIPSWGNMLQHARSYISNAPWYVLAPGIFIFLAVLTFNLAGDWLREIVDPRLRTL